MAGSAAAEGGQGLAIITGAGRGLGFAFAQVLLRERLVSAVALLDIAGAPEAAWRLETEFGVGCARGWKLDVTNLRALRSTFASAADWAAGKGIATTVVINNAGIAGNGLAGAAKVVAINLTAVVEGTRVAFDLMKGGSGGTVINVASFGAFVPMPFSPIYAATKAGVVALSRSCVHLAARDTDPVTGAPTGRQVHAPVCVVALCPAFADTAMVRDPMAAEGSGGAFSSVVEMQGGLMTTDFVASHAAEIVSRCRDAASGEDPCELAGEAVVVLPKGGRVAPPPSVRGDRFSLLRPSKL
ncbi:hypothetical protein FNF29_07531 [Cafeteria roenbergensis]|uniref:15-hydroxyprostaglandin dehydrogenase n=1 Tax=Cafeteria roenbergensis TaxID=33653 RepID=A0A5A8C3Q6_CAFRO|nr:hypothetical protein FNF29_07531 [Cafeteria roenbergensis]KAA0147976.1 hypothetical protein FNF28_07503 [Cafeteria roenbergensis]KAA0158853.1 hypothetical protein FNF31_05146 [Cafeteria roenbergensis]|eukprot:KAA0147159.1 hypothetical protein FNF29_07531 [Cafeteria roenbergensis]